MSWRRSSRRRPPKRRWPRAPGPPGSPRRRPARRQLAAAAAAAARDDTLAAGRELAAARAAAAREPAARHLLELACARLAAAVDAAERRVEVTELSSRREAVRRQRDDARERWLDLREQRLLGVAAELAAALADGDACPVCGSLEHPALAAVPRTGGRPHVAPALAAAAAEEQAGADAEAADELLRRCESELARARAQAESAAAAAGGRSVDTARAEAEAASADLDAARRAVAAEAAALARQERAELAVEAARGRSDRAVERLQRTTTELTRLEERLLALRHRLDAGGAEYDSVGARRAHASRRALAATGLLDARRELRRATEHLAEVTGTARAAASDAGFGDLESACRAALPDAELAALDQACSTHAHEQAMVDEGLADPALAAATAAAGVDPRAAETAWQLAQADDEAAATVLDRCATAHGALTVIEAQLAAHLAETRPVRDRYRVESGLSRCLDGTGGDNALRMSLSSYVLAARLEQVAAAATERLLVMSGGRYSLEHSDGAERGRGRSGLALRVVDGWTGRSRDTASLSGGEAFYTSLALALGLADVVAAEAGGATIETLFVDEGFGSLDDDTLSEVMDVLDGLRIVRRTGSSASSATSPTCATRIPGAPRGRQDAGRFDAAPGQRLTRPLVMRGRPPGPWRRRAAPGRRTAPGRRPPPRAASQLDRSSGWVEITTWSGRNSRIASSSATAAGSRRARRRRQALAAQGLQGRSSRPGGLGRRPPTRTRHPSFGLARCPPGSPAPDEVLRLLAAVDAVQRVVQRTCRSTVSLASTTTRASAVRGVLAASAPPSRPATG